jgi:HSP20 family protein
MYLTTLNNTLPKTIDKLFGDFFTDDFYAPMASQPKMDIHKTENEYQVTLELPGYEQKDISVNIENNNLKITGEIKKEEKSDTKTIHKEIYSQTRFERNVSLSNQIDVEKISAKINNGILKIELPLSEKAKPKQIEVKVS